MRRKISLFIDGKEVDLNEQSFILFTYTLEELSNPTIVKNSFSKQLTLPGTKNNNEIFGNIFRLDRVTFYDSPCFDPSRKTPFVIYNERNEVLESGYVKLDKVTRDKDRVEYAVTLYGGLGSFLYGLMYDEDGNKKSLLGMTYKLGNGVRSRFFKAEGADHYLVKEAWEYFSQGEDFDFSEATHKYWNVVNFAPCYNGLPDKFDANKAVVADRYNNVQSYGVVDGETFTIKTGLSSKLMTFAKSHDEWEMKDLRWYLQRPIISLEAILEAIKQPENNGGYSVEYELGNNVLDMIRNAWITLPMIPVEERGSADFFESLLASTKSPAEYLISLAKIWGLLFICDDKNKTIKLTERSYYYQRRGEVIDLTDRVDRRSLSIKPILGDAHYYQMGGNVIGEWAADYAKDFGLEYGIQRINTGYDFDSAVKKITDSIVFKEAVEVQERSLLFTSDGYNDDLRYFLLPKYESVTIQLWNGNKSEDFSVRLSDPTTIYNFDNQFPLSDLLPKVQLHDVDKKAIDGADVLLFFNGIKQTPTFNGETFYYYITDDTPDMITLNNQPCWNLTSINSIGWGRMPSFRRVKTHLSLDNQSEIIDYSWEWGTPKARGVNRIHPDYDSSIFKVFWKEYLTDRYDVDTYLLTCKVYLLDMKVDQELLGKFFYYEGSIFVLNKISNHSLTTLDDTECEFVRVQNINNYI